MKLQAGIALVCLSASTAYAGGIERTTQSAMILYSEGNRVELSYGYVKPSVSGTSRRLVAPIGNVAKDFSVPSFALKMDVDEKLAFALIYDTPFASDVEYPANPMLGGTMASSNTDTLTALGKYQLTEQASVFGGLRIQKASGAITLKGLAYGPLSGYSVDLGEDTAVGYVLGAAYEIPDIAMRVALTYNSDIEHDFDTVENLAPTVTSSTKTKTPSSWNLEFQTGIAADTLLMGSIRYVKHSEFKVVPVVFGKFRPDGLVNLEDTTTYRLGVGRRFNDRLSGSIMVGYEKEGDPLVSPLAPSTGMTSLTLGVSYKISDQVELGGGISRTWLGNATPQTANLAQADFKDNSATALGLKVTYSF
ncbi:OmpP1/FadL family transporter [Pseudooceanicola spongiae]|uniref:Transporter n=1 Tax=Pseudooceanicola spongiae TaxID=2613965 RepID=A0A7L9WJV7_9RHOB|nr:outer membrane protein transport protein [Pseudooceanicola spongiae]QOL80252.1 transporter [Pseudooceanicola spongiae]